MKNSLTIEFDGSNGQGGEVATIDQGETTERGLGRGDEV
jgi:hypothetical protein